MVNFVNLLSNVSSFPWDKRVKFKGRRTLCSTPGTQLPKPKTQFPKDNLNQKITIQS